MLISYGNVMFDDVTGDVYENEERSERDEDEHNAKFTITDRAEMEHWKAEERRKSEIVDKLLARAYGERSI